MLWMPTVIFQLIYTCALAPATPVKELRAIAEQSSEKNAARGLTGVLLCEDGSILQVLEGEKSVVEDLFAKISEDTRVTAPLVLLRRVTSAREFPNWSMGYRHTEDCCPAFELDAGSLRSAMPSNPTPEVRTIGRTFARVNGLSFA